MNCAEKVINHEASLIASLSLSLATMPIHGVAKWVSLRGTHGYQDNTGYAGKDKDWDESETPKSWSIRYQAMPD